MKKNVESAINKQIQAEFYSAYMYLAMAAYFDSSDLPGMANWMKIQAQEEITHGMKFYQFLVDRGATPVMEALQKPTATYASPLAVFKAALKHEQLVTSLIHNLYELAVKEKDYAFQSFLKWYIDEQVEEEANATEMIDKIKLAGEKGPGLFMLDKELAARKFNAAEEV